MTLASIRQLIDTIKGKSKTKQKRSKIIRFLVMRTEDLPSQQLSVSPTAVSTAVITPHTTPPGPIHPVTGSSYLPTTFLQSSPPLPSPLITQAGLFFYEFGFLVWVYLFF